MAKRRPAVTVLRLASALKLQPCVIYRWIKKGFVPVMHLRSYHKKGNLVLKREDAVWIIHNWRRSCTPTKASRILNVSDGSMGYFIRKNILKSVKMFGHYRIILDSIPDAKELIGKDVINPGLIGFARYSPEKRREFSKIGRNHYKLTTADRQKGARRMNQILIETGKAHRWQPNTEEARQASGRGLEARKNKKINLVSVKDSDSGDIPV